MSSAKDFLRRLADFLRKILGHRDHDHPPTPVSPMKGGSIKAEEISNG